ncbi:HAD family hydrolase [Cellulomonas humilata]|uniref:HAD superfamily hydrolase (TIGR01484 family) n=1 Tax=Cellulomonas humilata TaxID=144055 RepID=A0ABU0E8W8_9CELL|nr:HAD family hydrolase [Cellulomonas humilata]MDQ0371711.1 HAD superfamily hydrolase (TIGR01484 family) [Cellulomonas humilata]
MNHEQRAPRLVATDLDGTLLRPDGTVSPRTASALLRAAEAGVEVVFVTARPPRWLRELASHVAGHGVAICLNGAAVLEVGTGRMLAERGMPPELVGRIADRIRTAWGGPDVVHLAVERAAGFAHETRFRSSHPVPPGSPSADRIEDVLGPSTFKLLVRSTRPPSDAYSDELAVVVGDLAIVADSGAEGLGEISGPGITKAATLADWAATRGIDPADVWAVGDARNDLSMLGWAGTSFAVANAHPTVLAAATRRCASNADDGVADVLDLAGALAEGVLGSSR